ncbi:hypothetical protein FOXYSP1_12537 [Fusarium oxysporum f. sp. phaseoli]
MLHARDDLEPHEAQHNTVTPCIVIYIKHSSFVIHICLICSYIVLVCTRSPNHWFPSNDSSLRDHSLSYESSTTNSPL